jgi:hypothetical protein
MNDRRRVIIGAVAMGEIVAVLRKLPDLQNLS